MKCAERLCVLRLQEFQTVYSTGLTEKRKLLKATVDSELFSSTVAHITLLINFIVQSSGVEVRDYLDKTLKDRIPVGQWKTLRIGGYFHSIWTKMLKQIAINNQSQTP